MPRRSALLASVPGVVHAFTERADGGGDDPEAIARAAGAPGVGVAWCKQVHGALCIEVDAPGFAGEADALITRTPNLLLSIRVADCVPVLLAGGEPEGGRTPPLGRLAGRRTVAAIHAGWRGLAAGVIPATLAALARAGERPDGLMAAVGPCICADCYEVGPEVTLGIAQRVPEDVFVRSSTEGRSHADLRAAAAWQLREAGLGGIEVLPDCTRCSPAFWSWRRDGPGAGRQAGVVGRQ